MLMTSHRGRLHKGCENQSLIAGIGLATRGPPSQTQIFSYNKSLFPYAYNSTSIPETTPPF